MSLNFGEVIKAKLSQASFLIVPSQFMYIRYCCGNKNLYVSQRFMILVKIMWIRKSKYNTFQIWEQGKSLYWASVNFSQSQHYLRKTTTIIFSYQLWLKIKWDGNRLYCEIFDSFRILGTYNNIWCTWIGSGRFKSLINIENSFAL